MISAIGILGFVVSVLIIRIRDNFIHDRLDHWCALVAIISILMLAYSALNLAWNYLP